MYLKLSTSVPFFITKFFAIPKLNTPYLTSKTTPTITMAFPPSKQPHFHLLQIFFILYFSSSSYAQIPDTSAKVDLTLYYEALCPYCSYFVAQDLVKLFTSDLISIVNLRLVPWGNAALDPSGAFRCQHGAGECLLNTVEACAVNAYPDPYKHYSLIQCIESLAYQQRQAQWQSCFAQVSLDSQPVFDCYNQGYGQRLELANAYETKQLNPPHSYVPWVVVNNQPLQEDYRNFIAHVCSAYKGASIPVACTSSQFPINSFVNEMTDAAPQACCAGLAENLTSFLPNDILKQSKEVFTRILQNP